MQCQVQLKAFINRFQVLVVAVPLNLPITIPDATQGFAHGGDARASSVRSFRMEKLPAVKIGQREVCKVEILDFPGSVVGGLPDDPLAKGGQFETDVAGP